MIQLIRATSSALLIALIGLIGRAILDKLLAIKGGPELVADWAQILSLTELFIGPIGAGVGIGLTALVSRTDCQIRRSDILDEAWRAFRYALLASGICLVWIGIFYSWQFPEKKSLWPILGAATIAGIAGAYLSLLNAWWSGKEERLRILFYTICNSVVIAVTAWLSAPNEILNHLIISQTLIAIILLALSSRASSNKSREINQPKLKKQIDKYLLAGMVIGFMSPLSLLATRHLLNQYGPHEAAGLIQSIWRLSEWVATPAATILAVYFLPKFSQLKNDRQQLHSIIKQSSLFLLGTAAFTYCLIYTVHQEIFSKLYSDAFQPEAHLLLYFLMGDWLRIASWIFLFYFYAQGAIKTIIVGEFLSLPLFCGLLAVNKLNLSFELIGYYYFATYGCYFLFNFLIYKKINSSS